METTLHFNQSSETKAALRNQTKFWFMQQDSQQAFDFYFVYLGESERLNPKH